MEKILIFDNIYLTTKNTRNFAKNAKNEANLKSNEIFGVNGRIEMLFISKWVHKISENVIYKQL